LFYGIFASLAIVPSGGASEIMGFLGFWRKQTAVFARVTALFRVNISLDPNANCVGRGFIGARMGKFHCWMLIFYVYLGLAAANGADGASRGDRRSRGKAAAEKMEER
jgi:hypothetical protein